MPRYTDESTGITISSDAELTTAELEEAFGKVGQPSTPAPSTSAMPRSIAEREKEAREDFEKRSYLARQKEYFAKVPEAAWTALKQSPAVIAEGTLGFMKMIEKNPILSPAGAVRGIGRQIGSAISGTPMPDEQNPLDYGINELREYTRSLEPHYEQGTPEYYAHAAILSLSQNVIPILVGTVTGGQALPLFMMGAQSAGSKYNDLIENGMSHEKASVVAGMWGAAEAIGERFSIKALTKGPALSRIILGTLTDIPGELFTEVLQAGIDAGILGEDDAFNMQRFYDTAIITGISSPFLGAGSASISKLAKRKGIPVVARENVPVEAANVPTVTPETTAPQTEQKGAETAPEVIPEINVPEAPVESVETITERIEQEIERR